MTAAPAPNPWAWLQKGGLAVGALMLVDAALIVVEGAIPGRPDLSLWRHGTIANIAKVLPWTAVGIMTLWVAAYAGPSAALRRRLRTALLALAAVLVLLMIPYAIETPELIGVLPEAQRPRFGVVVAKTFALLALGALGLWLAARALPAEPAPAPAE